MKKPFHLLLCAAGILVPMLLAAQERRHEVSFSLGCMPTDYMTLDNYYFSWSRSDLAGMYEPQTSGASGMGLFSVDYFYHAFPFWQFGGMLGWTRSSLSRSIPATDVTLSDEVHNFIHILPRLRGIWTDKGWRRWYSGGGLGLTVEAVSTGDHLGLHPQFAYEVVPIGVQLGQNALRVSAEYAFGSTVLGCRFSISYQF